MATRVYYGPELARYGFGQGHPFGPDRLDAFWQELVRRGLDRQVLRAQPVMCQESELIAFHLPAYVEQVKQQSVTGEGYLDYGDTPAFPGVFEAASYVVGSTLDAGRWSMGEHGGRAFVPIGGLHHAARERAAGFCVFNDIGVLVEVLRRERRAQRIAYVDIDAHHGDGVYYPFESDPDLYIADIHEDGRYLYPGTGAAEETGSGAAVGTKLNLPLAPGADDRDFERVWPQVEELVRTAKPELILLQAGADSIAGDPITHLRFTPRAHAHAARRLCVLADEFCNGRLIAMGGGGYNRANLAAAWTEVVAALQH